MARCPTCQRRLAPAASCPGDGGMAPALPAEEPVEPPRIEGFTVTRLLGTGGFGSVWEATVEGGPALVAIKIAHGAAAAGVLRLRREAEALARVGPPHVPILHGSGTLGDGRPYLAMERLFGRTLAEEIEGWREPPSLALVRTLGGALLESAAALHARGVLHRDLKPENAFLVNEGTLVAKLMDFGLARSVGPSAAQDHTHSGPGAGTPEYISPEQISGRNADLRSDVYALGVMLFELLTLRLPFGGDARELEYAHLSLRPPRPSRFAAVPKPLEDVVLDCLAKDPRSRFADAEALRTAFARALDEVPASAGRAPTPSLAAPAGAKRGALRASERQKVALVFAQGARISAVEIQVALEPFGGQLASAAPGRCVCAFTHRAGDNPGQRAHGAAEALIGKDLAERAIVDVGTVAVKPRPQGAPRLFSPLFNDAARYPTANDPRGILLSAAACAMLPAVSCEPAPGRSDYFRPVAGADEGLTQSRTTVQDGPAALVGRADTVRRLIDEALRAVAEARPRVASVLGEPGLGKTRLAQEIAHLLRTRLGSAEVIWLRAREPLGSDADEALAELLRRALQLPREAPPDGGRDLLAERLGDLAREAYAGCALLLGWIGPDHPAVQALRAAAGVLRASVARAGMEALGRLAAVRPVLVLLDDAHWADDALLDALEQATVSELPLWVCAFGRPAFAQNRPTWGKRAASVTVERLAPLDRESAAELCRQLLHPAEGVPEPVITRLVDRAQAVPQLLCDLVRGLRGEGLVREREGGVWYVATEVLDELPDSPLAEWIAGRELDELPAELSAHARLASLLSAEFTADEVEGILGMMDEELSESFPLDARIGTERLKQSRLLVQHRTGRLGFRNAVTREAVATTVAEPLAVRIHHAALAYYRTAALPEASRLPRLAWHAAQAGEHREAASTYSTLAEIARGRHNYLVADLLYTHALAELDDTEQDKRLGALKGRGIVRYRLGRYDGSLSDLAQARELAGASGDPITQADVMLDESMALDWLLEWHRSRELAERARELTAGREEPLLRARVLLALGRSLHRFNQDDEAADLLREAVRIAEAVGDEGYEVQVAAGLMLGFFLPFLGLLDEAEERLLGINAICEQKGDEMHLAALWNNRSCLWIARNDRDKFMQDNGRVLSYARRMGNANLERNANLNSAYYLYWRAEFAAAEPFARRMIEIDERYFRQGGFRPEGAVLLARILWGMGDHASARRLVREVRENQQAARAENKNELLLQPNDEMLLDMIDLVLEDAESARWDELMARARDVAAGQELIEALEVAGIAALERGDRQEARRWWREALEAGERIPNVMQGRIEQRLADLG